MNSQFQLGLLGLLLAAWIATGCVADFPDAPQSADQGSVSAVPDLGVESPPNDSGSRLFDAGPQPMDADVVEVDMLGPAFDAQVPVDARIEADAGRPDPGLLPPFHRVVFGASHNSYSGGPLRDGVLAQLATGVRLLEFDLHDNHFEREGDWPLGHNRDGDDVQFGGGNPDSELLGEWLDLVVSWSDENPEHAPLTLVLDLKDSLKDNDSPEKGNLGALNMVIEERLGDKLYPRREHEGEWPSVSHLLGRILVVLSGNQDSRRAYSVDFGYDPAVSMNASGQVIAIHHSGTGRLWYWTGQVQADNRIHWIHHGKLDNGMEPSVVLTDDGYFVEVHKSENHDTLFYRVGRLTADYRIELPHHAREMVDGNRPTLKLRPNGQVGLIYEYPSNQQRWYALGLLGRDEFEVDWGDSVVTDQLGYDKTRSGDLRVFTRREGVLAQEVLSYSHGGHVGQRIRYKQNLFIEYQPGDNDDILENALFFAATAGFARILDVFRDRGPVRLWGIGQAQIMNEPFPNFPAVDQPLSAWYGETMRRRLALDWPQ